LAKATDKANALKSKLIEIETILGITGDDLKKLRGEMASTPMERFKIL
jgi:hypothetical protein